MPYRRLVEAAAQVGRDDMAQADPPDFGALMAAANAGDAEAYARLLRMLMPLVRQVVRRQRRFGGAEDIEDVVQDVLLSVHSVRGTYDPGRPFLPWLLAIVRRRIVDAGRRQMRQGAREVALDEEGSVTFAASETNTYGEELAQADALSVAIGSLPRGQREAIELLKLQEMSLREASAVTGLSVGALKVATHRAIAALRVRLKKYGH